MYDDQPAPRSLRLSPGDRPHPAFSGMPHNTPTADTRTSASRYNMCAWPSVGQRRAGLRGGAVTVFRVKENGGIACKLPGALAVRAVVAVTGLAGAIVHRREAEHGLSCCVERPAHPCDRILCYLAWYFRSVVHPRLSASYSSRFVVDTTIDTGDISCHSQAAGR